MKFLTGVLLFWGVVGVYAQEGDRDDYSDSIRKKFLSESKALSLYKGDRKISSGREVKGDVLVLNGNLNVEGTITGKAVVSNGDLIIRNGGRILKDAVAVNGRVVTDNADNVSGSVFQVKPSIFSDQSGVKDDAEEISDESELAAIEIPENLSANLESAELNRKLEEMTLKMEALQAELREDKSNPFGYSYSTNKQEKGKNKKKHSSKSDKYKRYDYSNSENSSHDEEEREDDQDTQPDRSEDRMHSASFVRVDNDETDEDSRESDPVLRRSFNYRDYEKNSYNPFRNTSFFLFDYNRVNGIYLGGKVDRYHKMYENKPFQLYGEAGYAFGQKGIRYRLGLDKIWGNPGSRFTLGGEVHDLTSTQDDWIVGGLENAMYSVLLKLDYRDYYRTQGFSLQAQQNLNPELKLSLAYKVDTYSSVSNTVNWALFRSKNIEFRANPLINDGRMATFVGRAELNSTSQIQDRKSIRRVGWVAFAEAERSRPNWNSDFNFSRYVFSVARLQPLSRWENLNVRIMGGAATGDVPIQKQFSLGGFSSLRGFDFKQFSGNQMFLTNIEYRINSNAFGQVFPVHPFTAILFADAGYTWTNKIFGIKQVFSGVHGRDLQSDIGLGIGDESDFIRLDIAKPITERKSDYKVSMRLNYIF